LYGVGFFYPVLDDLDGVGIAEINSDIISDPLGSRIGTVPFGQSDLILEDTNSLITSGVAAGILKIRSQVISGESVTYIEAVWF